VILQPFSVFSSGVDVPGREADLLIRVLLRIFERDVGTLNRLNAFDGVVAEEILVKITTSSRRPTVRINWDSPNAVAAVVDDAVAGGVVPNEVADLELARVLNTLSDLNRRGWRP
jgi:hypothetical protein